MSAKKQRGLPQHEAQRYINALVAYRNTLPPNDPNRAIIDRQLANKEPVIVRIEIFKYRITKNPDDQHTLITVTGIIAFGWAVGNTPATIELLAPDTKPDELLRINANWLTYLHGSRSNIQWQSDPATQTPLHQRKTPKP